MGTYIDLPLAQTKAALKTAYDQAARAEKAQEMKLGAESPITKEYARIRLTLNAAILSAKELNTK